MQLDSVFEIKVTEEILNQIKAGSKEYSVCNGYLHLDVKSLTAKTQTIFGSKGQKNNLNIIREKIELSSITWVIQKQYNQEYSG